MNYPGTLAFAIATGLAFSQPAVAASSSSSSITDFVVELFPAAGSAPTSISFSDGVNPYIYSFVYSGSNSSGNARYALPNDSITSQLGGATSTATVAGASPQYSGISLSASGSAISSGEQSTYQSVVYTNNFQFTLSPNTLAVFRAQANAVADTTLGYHPVIGSGEYAYASAYMQGSISSGTSSNNGSGSQSATAYYSYTCIGSVCSYGGTSSTASGSIGFALSNLTNSDAHGHLYLSADVYGYSNIASVPEPESWALMVAGLGLVGFAKRGMRLSKVAC